MVIYQDTFGLKSSDFQVRVGNAMVTGELRHNAKISVSGKRAAQREHVYQPAHGPYHFTTALPKTKKGDTSKPASCGIGNNMVTITTQTVIDEFDCPMEVVDEAQDDQGVRERQ